MINNTTFDEKLHLIKNIYFEKDCQTFSEDEIAYVEEKLQFTMPLALKKFYLIFGADYDFLKCMYDIATPKELYIENNILMIAREYQNVCGYGIDINTQRPIYFDISNSIIQTVEQDIEDFLLYLLAVQGTQFFPCVGKVNLELAEKLEKNLVRISKADGEGCVFCDKKSIIAFAAGNELFITAKDDECMEKLENECGLEVDYL